MYFDPVTLFLIPDNIFKYDLGIIRTVILTNLHEMWKENVASRVFKVFAMF